MRDEPTTAYVYQPLPPQEDGKFYGVGGLHLFGVDVDLRLKGITKTDAENVARLCNETPVEAKALIEWAHDRISNDWRPECGCRFESIFSNTVLLCQKCSGCDCRCYIFRELKWRS